MRQPSAPGNNGQQRARPRGAIRTHLGRKRTGARGRPLGASRVTIRPRHRPSFDKLRTRSQEYQGEVPKISSC